MKFLLCAALLLTAACPDAEPRLRQRNDACTKNRDCTYGLDCVEVAGAGKKTCQYHSFGDCEGDGSQPAPDGEPQCLNSYKCRDGHCTVQCAGHKDCKEGEVCKVGLCQKGHNANAQCYDNRDCPYPETCAYGQCVTHAPSERCVSDLDCGAGLRCINAVCQ